MNKHDEAMLWLERNAKTNKHAKLTVDLITGLYIENNEIENFYIEALGQMGVDMEVEH